MLGLINSIVSLGGAVDKYIRNGLVMANRFTLQGLNFPVQGSAEFNGTSDFITSDSLPISDFTNFTMSGWVYVESSVSTQNFFGFTNTTNDNPIAILEYRTTNVIRFNYRTDAPVLTSTDSDSISFNKWYFITATKEGGNLKIYLDGSLNNSNTISDTTITINAFTMGSLNRTTNLNYFNGNLANVAIWNRALSSDEINSVMWKSYEALTSAESNGLQAWYSLDDISGTSVPDSSGNGNTGTAN